MTITKGETMKTWEPKGLRAQFLETEFHCVVCTGKIPPEQLKYKAITCSDKCGLARKNALRAKQDSRECRHCRKPASLAERAAYKRFRKWEKVNPELAYPEAYKRWNPDIAEDIDGKAVFTLEIAQQIEQELEDERRRADEAHAQVGPLQPQGDALPDTSSIGQ